MDLGPDPYGLTDPKMVISIHIERKIDRLDVDGNLGIS